MSTKRICDICGGVIEPVGSWTEGNNAAPFEGRACNDCNSRYVIPARLMGTKAPYREIIKSFAALGRTFVGLAK